VGAFRYAFDEATRSLWRGKQAGLLSIGTIAVAIFVLGGLTIVTGNLRQIGDEWSRSAEMSVYFHDEATEAERRAVEEALGGSGLVASQEFVSKAEALTRFKQTFADLAGTVDTLGANPLPASIESRLLPASEAPGVLDALGTRLRAMPGVVDVRYDREWLDRLLAGVRVVRTAGLVLSAVLVIGAALTVANVVRLALVARRDEIDIMHLIGAPTVFVRGPFIVEGVLQGGIGALLALAALGGVFLSLRGAYLIPLATTLNVSGIRFMTAPMLLLLLAGGMAVGCLGGVIASRRS